MKGKFSLSIIVIIYLFTITGFALGSAVAEEETIELEVASFQGGYGIDWLENIGREYEKLNPNVKVNVWGNPRVWEQLRPRFISGDPPDVCAPGWGFDIWGAIYEDMLYPLDEALESKAYDQDVIWKDTFVEGQLDTGKWEGKHYIMPLFLNIFGWWYNETLFKENAWDVPETWDEFLTFSEKAKAKGIAPLTTQGIYPSYAVSSYFIPFAIRNGGLEMYKDAINLEPGAWKNPAFLKSAQTIRELMALGYFEKGCMGMNHTEAQMDWLNGKAAIIGCGSYLEAEMKDVTPEDFRMRFMRVPAFKGETGDRTTVEVGQAIAANFIVPKDGNHHEIALDFLKFATSLSHAKMLAREKNTLIAIKGSESAITSEILLSAVEAAKEARETYSVNVPMFPYPTLSKVIGDGLTGLMIGEITVNEFVEKIEMEATRIRQDETIPKHLY